ncbi:hypothetical protein BDP27DRAFT_37391 [Rhodocollybia butyracea]|uniref:Chromo domain-containing protein n=1 Tax=Rhodocollybia butyracea TaxID=206335 RepID=A0A9P5Q6A5_9AGAR|nr:hypothetical protein BDP27DRAFT_37391 [Rhodocollybia butyracea]
MSDEEEYIVESITAARVKKGGRAGKTWEYLVKWKNYEEDENTWEPVKSFNDGSEHFVHTFWERASKSLGGRDYKDLNSFKTGEEFFPVGPPLKKKQSKRTSTPVSSGSATLKNNKRARSDTPIDTAPTEPSPKRARHNRLEDSRPEPSRRRSARNLTNTPDTLESQSNRRSTRARKPKEPSIVPATDDEEDQLDLIEVTASVTRRRPSRSSSTEDEEEHDPVLQPSLPPSPPALPPHKARLANPRVRMLDTFDTDAIGISATKARVLGKGKDKESASSSVNTQKKQKPGPGRSSEGFGKTTNHSKTSTSSILTSHKGKLKTVKGKFVGPTPTSSKEAERQEDPIIVDEPLPTPKELLQIASRGMDGGDELQDFEEADVLPARDPTPAPAPAPIPSDGGSNSILQRSLSLAKESLFPRSTWSATASIVSAATAWTRPTIFGPLSLGSESRPTSDTTENSARASNATTTPFSLCLDVASKLPVVLTALSSTDAPVMEKVIRNVSRGLPGKFYSNDAAIKILDCIRTGGGTARVIPAPNATEEEKKNFERFEERLSGNEVFVFMAGVDPLVFCSSNASLITNRLNLPTLLLSEPGSVLVERVSIFNHMAYAHAVESSVGW